MYEIRKNEPEGWKKAFEVLKDGKHVSWFRYRDDADAYVHDRTVKVVGYIEITPRPAMRAAVLANM